MTRVAGLILLLGIGTLSGVAACRRPPLCPPGHDEGPGPLPDTVWCRQPGGNQALLLQTFPGSRVRRQLCPFVAGRLEGEFQGFHPDGRPWLKGRYAEGRLQGVWLQTDPQGVKVADGEYREGRLVAGAPVAVGAICESVKP